MAQEDIQGNGWRRRDRRHRLAKVRPAGAEIKRPVAVEMKPQIAITVGDPSGIGPEIAEKAAADARVRDGCEPVLYGPANPAVFPPGVVSADAGRAAYEATCSAVHDAQVRVVQGIATAPISKLAFAKAGLTWKGHTDLLAHLTGSRRVAMMFWSQPLKVVLASVHLPLAEVARALT